MDLNKVLDYSSPQKIKNYFNKPLTLIRDNFNTKKACISYPLQNIKHANQINKYY